MLGYCENYLRIFFSVPEGLKLRILEERDVPVIAKTWTYENPDIVKSVIKQGPCIGLENENGDLTGTQTTKF